MANFAAALPTPSPTPIILDTDMGNDVDDVIALSMLHALQSRGECRIAAVTITKDNDLAAPFVDAVNTFYGRPNIPIGAVHDGKTRATGHFLELALATDNGKPRYPHTLCKGSDAIEATKLLRSTLAAEVDGSVVMIQIGFSTNLARLLDSMADDVSPLDGVQLVKRKVKLLSAMAGAFAVVGGSDHYCEYNVTNDIPSANRVFTDWPTQIVFTGFEVGTAIPFPATSIERDYSYVPHHILAEAYRLFLPKMENRPNWDPSALLYAVRPDQDYFGLSEPGRAIVEDDGFVRWEPQAEGACRFLKIDHTRTARATEAIVELAKQPPAQGSAMTVAGTSPGI